MIRRRPPPPARRRAGCSARFRRSWACAGDDRLKMTSISITGIGAVTPVALSAPASAAAFRAGIARLARLDAEESGGPEGPVPLRTGGRAPLEWFDGGPRIQEWPGHERFEPPIPPPDHLIIDDGA